MHTSDLETQKQFFSSEKMSARSRGAMFTILQREKLISFKEESNIY